MLNNILYNSFLQDLNNDNVNYIIFGSHGLYLLNEKFDLNLNINLQVKDLDILISSQDIEYLKNKYGDKYNFLSISNHKILKNAIYESKNCKIDLIDNIADRHMVIDNNFILNFNYDNLKDYNYTGIIYDSSVKYLNLEAYYGIIKRTGLKKYKNIISVILNKYPLLKTSVLA